MTHVSGPPGHSATKITASSARKATIVGSATVTLRNQDGPWIAQWLSQERLNVYLAATATRSDALALYEWNCEASTAVFRDLGHIEIALRNAYNHAIEAAWSGPGHWTDHPNIFFAPEYRTRRNRNGTRNRVDINKENRKILTAARAKAIEDAAPSAHSPGKVVAELSFGFWRFLTDRPHETSVWTPYLHHAFPAGTNRRDVDKMVVGLHRLRNRVAHHEPLFTANLAAQHASILALATLFDPSMAAYIAGRSAVPQLVQTRPPLSTP